MTTVTEVEYSVEAIEDANTALLALIDAGASAGSIKIYDESDTQLASIPLSDPAGTVSAVTGLLTLSIAGNDEAPVAGTAEYADVMDSDGNVHIRLPVQEGGAAVSGYCVINSVSILADTIVSVASATVG